MIETRKPGMKEDRKDAKLSATAIYLWCVL